MVAVRTPRLCRRAWRRGLARIPRSDIRRFQRASFGPLSRAKKRRARMPDGESAIDRAVGAATILAALKQIVIRLSRRASPCPSPEVQPTTTSSAPTSQRSSPA
jgi:hypothetical protein